MRFLAPGMLWFAALLAPLVAAYLLKVRPTRRATTTLFLWDELLQQRRATTLFNRLRDLLSLAYYARRGEMRASDLAEAMNPLRKDEVIASWLDPRASVYYPLYGLRQWRAKRRGQDTGP